MLKGRFDLEDFLDQLQKIKKMGPAEPDPGDDPGYRLHN